MKVYFVALILGCIGNMLSLNGISCPVGSIIAIIIIGKHIESKIEKHFEDIKNHLKFNRTV